MRCTRAASRSSAPSWTRCGRSSSRRSRGPRNGRRLRRCPFTLRRRPCRRRRMSTLLRSRHLRGRRRLRRRDPQNRRLRLVARWVNSPRTGISSAPRVRDRGWRRHGAGHRLLLRPRSQSRLDRRRHADRARRRPRPRSCSRPDWCCEHATGSTGRRSPQLRPASRARTRPLQPRLSASISYRTRLRFRSPA